MGRSSSYNSSTAIDNRLAVTDDAFGLSSSGTSNNVALDGNIYNLNASASGGVSNRSRSGLDPIYQPFGAGKKGGEGGQIVVNTLDGDAINRAFDFASLSLSAMLDSIVSGQKLAQESSEYVGDAISRAVTSAATTNAAATAAATAASKELNGDKQEQGKKLLIGLGVLGAGYWYFKGRK